MLLKDKRAGILLHITSLDSKEGIGTLGAGAYAFVDFLKDAGQTYWQLLPLNPIGPGDSPYQSPCAFAGEPLLIDLELLCQQKLLSRDEIKHIPSNSGKTDYETVKKHKIPLLLKAAGRFDTKSEEFRQFKTENAHWLESFANFQQEEAGTAKKHTEILQYLFYKQWFDLKTYANKRGVYIIGDIPFYVAPRSSDVKSNPRLFKVGRDLTPTLVAGVPPDLFTKDGQLWGNPIYNWEQHRSENYGWWTARMAHCKKLYDVTRIDHFRAFSTYYTIPYGQETARQGRWEQGVGYSFFEQLERALGKMNIIAEDLGELSPDVPALLRKTGFPGMKVLQFAFDGNIKNPFLPRYYCKNCVCYTGTHDNDTTMGWYESLSDPERILFARRTPQGKDAAQRLIRYGMKSRANTVIIPLQDWLSLGSEGRMNIPGTTTGNWRWRAEKSLLTKTLRQEIREITAEYGRNH